MSYMDDQNTKSSETSTRCHDRASAGALGQCCSTCHGRKAVYVHMCESVMCNIVCNLRNEAILYFASSHHGARERKLRPLSLSDQVTKLTCLTVQPATCTQHQADLQSCNPLDSIDTEVAPKLLGRPGKAQATNDRGYIESRV